MEEGLYTPDLLPYPTPSEKNFLKNLRGFPGLGYYTFLQCTKFSFWQNCSNLQNRIFSLEYSRNTLTLKHWSICLHYKLADIKSIAFYSVNYFDSNQADKLIWHIINSHSTHFSQNLLSRNTSGKNN